MPHCAKGLRYYQLVAAAEEPEITFCESVFSGSRGVACSSHWASPLKASFHYGLTRGGGLNCHTDQLCCLSLKKMEANLNQGGDTTGDIKKYYFFMATDEEVRPRCSSELWHQMKQHPELSRFVLVELWTKEKRGTAHRPRSLFYSNSIMTS